MEPSNAGDPTGQMLQMISSLERRVARIEEYLSLEPVEAEEEPTTAAHPTTADEDELEYEIGQNWFAKAGIVVAAIGIAFVLTFPFEGLPDFLPGAAGFVIVAGVLGLSRLWRGSFPLISRYLVGGAMALSYFSSLRLSFFGAESFLMPGSLASGLLLVVVTAFNIAFAVRRKSVYLLSLSLTMGYATALVVGEAGFVLAALVALSGLASLLRVRFQIPGLLTYAILLSYLTHLLWAVGNPFLGNEIHIVQSPYANIYCLLLYAVLFALGVLFRRDNETEKPSTLFNASLNGFASYGLYLILTLTTFQDAFVLSHTLAAAVYLALAIGFWIREKSRYSTFAYAMLGYVALTVAILKEFDPPDIFIWLSLVSIVVVSTAVWFRSRFIVVANFFIYITIVLAAFIVTPGEISLSGISSGIVALLSARILNWQQHRLELKTEMMRNAYLVSAFLLFPYAMYHLVPTEYLSLSWIGIAATYYALSSIIKAQKYRWMGHLTLILTILSVLVIGIVQLSPEYRIISFLALGVALVAVSLVYNRLRVQKRRETEDGKQAGESR